MRHFADGCGIVVETGIIGCQASPCERNHPPFPCPGCGQPLTMANVSVLPSKACVHVGCTGQATAPVAEPAPKAKRARKSKAEALPANPQSAPTCETTVPAVPMATPAHFMAAPASDADAAFRALAGAPIKALSLARPWPWAIFNLPPPVAKRIENRDRRLVELTYSPFIAIHASATWDEEAIETIRRIAGVPVPPAAEHPQGIVGLVHFTQVIERMSLDGHARARTDPWFFGPWGHAFDNVRALAEPIPCRGWPSVFKLTEAQATVVMAQLKRT